MTRNEFSALCGEYLIDPGIALEYDAILKAVPQGTAAVRAALEQEF